MTVTVNATARECAEEWETKIVREAGSATGLDAIDTHTDTHTLSQTLAARLGALPELLLLWLLYNTFREARNILLTFMTYRAVGPNSWPCPGCLAASPAALAALPHELKKRTNARHAPVCVFTSPLFAAPARPAANRVQSPAWLGVSCGLNKFITERSIDRLYVPSIVCCGSRGVVTLF